VKLLRRKGGGESEITGWGVGSLGGAREDAMEKERKRERPVAGQDQRWSDVARTNSGEEVKPNKAEVEKARPLEGACKVRKGGGPTVDHET